MDTELNGAEENASNLHLDGGAGKRKRGRPPGSKNRNKNYSKHGVLPCGGNPNNPKRVSKDYGVTVARNPNNLDQVTKDSLSIPADASPEAFRAAIADYVQRLAAAGAAIGIAPPSTVKELAQLVGIHTAVTGGPGQTLGGGVVPVHGRGLRRGNPQVVEAEEVPEIPPFEI